MYDSEFYKTKLGQASLASIAAMVLLVALSTQMQPSPVMAAAIGGDTVEIA